MIYTLDQGVNRSKREKLQKGLTLAVAMLAGIGMTALVFAGVRDNNEDSSDPPLTISTIRGGNTPSSQNGQGSSSPNAPSSNGQNTDNAQAGSSPSTISSNDPGYAAPATQRSSTTTQPSSPLPVGGSGGVAPISPAPLPSSPSPPSGSVLPTDPTLPPIPAPVPCQLQCILQP